MHHELVTEESVDEAHESGKLVHAWTANTAAMMVAMLDAGADAIVTNYPERLRQAIQQRLVKCNTTVAGVIDQAKELEHHAIEL